MAEANGKSGSEPARPSRWTQWAQPPKGALPGGLVTKAGIGLIAVMVGGLLLSRAFTGAGDEADAGGAAAGPRAVDDGLGRALEGRIRAETERETQQAAARAQRELERRRAEARPDAAPAAAADATTPHAAPMGAREAELLETLRLERIERRARSLRSSPVALTRRDPDERRAPAASVQAAGSGAGRGERDALDGALRSLERSAGRLEGEMAAALADASVSLPAAADAGAQGARGETPPATRFVGPTDPPGWERIPEGSFVEAVLVTQLSGEFPGPALAMVSTPLLSADRQRVLVPRGSRAVGVARAVQHRDQSRLAVTFHRLLKPDGAWVDLASPGLNQAGESALEDQVDRHALSSLLAAGAVGAISGLALAGGSPWGLRAGVGQGLGGSAGSVLDRYLNRIPTVTIRAGRRLRIWFSGDVLAPRPSRPPVRPGSARP